MTNDPTLPQQIANLAKYNHLYNKTPPPVIIYGEPVILPGAVNMEGLPGDASPEARFVRVAKKILFLQGDLQPKDSNEALTACMDIADAAKVSKEDCFVKVVKGKSVYDQTIYQIFKDSLNAILYFRTNADAALKAINLKELFGGDEELHPLLLHTSDKQTTIDVTIKMKECKIIDVASLV